MEDQKILDLFFRRSQQAIAETDRKYGSYLYTISYNILSDREDSKECVNDTYLGAWNAIPPKRPGFLGAFLGKMTRYISIDRWRKRNAKQRGGGEILRSLEELQECIAAADPEQELDRLELARVFREFLSSLSEPERNVFLSRYWYLESVQAISQASGFSQSKIHSMLHRLRGRLANKLREEGLL